jgi:hypothetical protein
MEDRAVVLFVYKRPELTIKVLEGLKKNEIKNLIVFCDGPKNTEDTEKIFEVQRLIKKIDWCHVELYCSESNKGLANSIIEGVSSVLKRFDKIVVLEDDCIPDTGFINFMDACLNKYKDNARIMSVTGYSLPIKIPDSYEYDVYFSYRAMSWGWGTWKKAWSKVDWEVSDYKEFAKDKTRQKNFNRGGNDLTRMLKKQMDGEIDSWAVRWAYAHSKENALCVCPSNTLISNIGFGSGATHCESEKGYEYYNRSVSDRELHSRDLRLPNELIINKKIYKRFKRVFRPVLINKLKQFLSPYIKKYIYKNNNS